MASRWMLASLVVLLHYYGCLPDCICPDSLPWADKPLGVDEDQHYCGRELNFITNSTDCERDVIYSCVINSTTPSKLWDCPNQSDHRTPFCAPHSEKNCYLKSKSLSWECMRIRTCRNEQFMKILYKAAYKVIPP